MKKIVHINFWDNFGGAAIAAYRHCEAMRRAGIDASMIVLDKQTTSKSFIHEAIPNKWKRKFFFLAQAVTQNFVKKKFAIKESYSYPVVSVKISENRLIKEADVIYIHWVAASMISTKEIEKLLKTGKPVRWYMHDMNPITGGCHYSLECKKYKTGCKDCKLTATRFMGIDLAKKQFDSRMRRWEKYDNLEAYTPSEWLAQCVMESDIWKGHKVTVFPNVLDTEKFHPADKNAARDMLGIKSNRKLILFGAADLGNEYKGWKYLCGAINSLDRDKYEAVIFGEERTEIKESVNIDCHFVGHLRDELSLIMVYNAADVFVSASLADNYPNVIIEAMACGVPCVGFRTGGLPDQIEHGKNGFLAEYRNTESLADGIRYVCECEEKEYLQMKKNARDFVCRVASYDKYKDI